MTVNLEVLDHNQVECDPDGTCHLCLRPHVVTIDIFQNLGPPPLGSRITPFACLACCQRIHETLEAALEAET